MRHATGISDFSIDDLEAILNRAITWKRSNSHPRHLTDRILGMVFFNPSLRTRASFEAVMARGGGTAIVLEVGSGVWKLEDRIGAIMDGDRAEHIKEAAPASPATWTCWPCAPSPAAAATPRTTPIRS